MNPTNSHDTLRYGAYRAASLHLNDENVCDSYIRGYEPDRRSTMPSQADFEVLYGSRAAQETSYILPASHGYSAHVGFPNASIVTIGGVGVLDAVVELFASQHDHVFELVSAWLEQEDETVLLDVAETYTVPEIMKGTSEPTTHDPMLARAIERLESFRKLGPNWNGYDGVPPTEQAIDECMAFARSLRPLAQGPVAMVSGQGEVGLFWERDSDDASVEIGFRGDGSYGFLAIMPDGTSTELEGVSMCEEYPPALSAALRVFLKE